jgi:quercetin dioxygenase-like cupin family protein
MAAILQSYQDAIAFRPERFHPVLVASGAHMKAVLTCLEPGQFIPVHRPGVDMLLIVLEGEGQVVAGDRQEPVRPGAVIFAAAGEARGVKAETRLVALHVVSPPPTEKDHVEVMARLQQGEWR